MCQQPQGMISIRSERTPSIITLHATQELDTTFVIFVLISANLSVLPFALFSPIFAQLLHHAHGEKLKVAFGRHSLYSCNKTNSIEESSLSITLVNSQSVHGKLSWISCSNTANIRPSKNIRRNIYSSQTQH